MRMSIKLFNCDMTLEKTPSITCSLVCEQSHQNIKLISYYGVYKIQNAPFQKANHFKWQILKLKVKVL